MSKNCMGLQPDHPLVRSSGEIREREGGGATCDRNTLISHLKLAEYSSHTVW